MTTFYLINLNYMQAMERGTTVADNADYAQELAHNILIDYVNAVYGDGEVPVSMDFKTLQGWCLRQGWLELYITPTTLQTRGA